MHIYNNHSFRINVFYFEIFLDALAPLKTMLLMNKNQSVSNREARMVRGDGGVRIYNNHFFKMGQYWIIFFYFLSRSGDLGISLV